jgi:putative Mg2+ transporter-C (MgtC) family protein
MLEKIVANLLSYWTLPMLAANGIILLHLFGSATTGLVIGYERTYHGRAAGMRTYALVCMASTALTVLSGFPSLWYGGMKMGASIGDPTRVIQGIMTGIGFLCAGVIVKENMNIKGLSTAASIWLTAVVGVLIGVGFYGAATTAALLAVITMSGLRWLEKLLPHQFLESLIVIYPRDKVASEDAIRQLVRRHGFEIVEWSYQTSGAGERFEYNLIMSQLGVGRSDKLAAELNANADVLEFRISQSRN